MFIADSTHNVSSTPLGVPCLGCWGLVVWTPHSTPNGVLHFWDVLAYKHDTPMG